MSRDDVFENEVGETDSEHDESAGTQGPVRINLVARRAIEDYQERRRLRHLLGEDTFDL